MKYILFLVSLVLFAACTKTNKQNDDNILQLKVLQFNIWQEGTMVENGFPAIADEIIRTGADLVALSEVRNYNDSAFSERIIGELQKKGYTFFGGKSTDTGLLSRYPIVSYTMPVPLTGDHGTVTKAILDIEGTEVAFYSAHLDYRHYACYLPRGYDGYHWHKLESPLTDSAAIAEYNLQSTRDEHIAIVIEDAELESEQGRLVILAGDFNEPSHLDWTAATKNLFDHNGVIMEWHTTFELEKAGFTDAYRERFPDPVTHPGFTFPADNPAVEIGKLTWAPTADERDRIDFVFYKPDSRIRLVDAEIVGPKGSIVRSERMQENTDDPFSEPAGIWPTDHKAVLATFKIDTLK